MGRPDRTRAAHLGGLALALGLTLGAGVAAAQDEPARAPSLDARIAEVEAAVARDEEAVRRLVAAPPVEGERLYESPELRAIARRLPELQASLRALREQRERGGSE